ncbi:two-component response regulator ARR5-like [Punica granatum]|uniref:Two-component response regulator ARR5-like n=1 Tax=Punica granatum TaxID=22663 RepID=A0A218XYM5_PUNGR|nr:two-component response regulator ARR5-like [Punica granatum]OWM89611.1 hypothetical protein CDL15_Pgr024359 [Punica granatum]
MARNGGFSRRRRSGSADGFDLSPTDSEEAHVLAVDDSLVDRKFIERLLKTSSCKVTAVDSGMRALQFLGLDEEKSPVDFDSLKVDLIITDYCMPGMTGYELLKKIKECSALREIPVVIMSSENVVARIDRCLEEGAEDFIMKPVKPSDVRRLKDYMARGFRGESCERNNHKRKLHDHSSDHLFQSSSPSVSPASWSSTSLTSGSADPSSPPSVSSSQPQSPLIASSAPSSPSSLEIWNHRPDGSE